MLGQQHDLPLDLGTGLLRRAVRGTTVLLQARWAELLIAAPPLPDRERAGPEEPGGGLDASLSNRLDQSQAVQASVARPSGNGIDNARGADNGTWIFIAGLSAVNLNDLATADQAEAQMHAMRERAESGGNAYAAKPFAIMEKEIALARGQKDDALRSAKEAADIDLTLAPPSGPPEPIKPGLELYGDLLLKTGHAKEAADTYHQELLRTPNRTPTVHGLKDATAQAGSLSSSLQQ